MNVDRPNDIEPVDGDVSQMEYHYKVGEVQAIDALIACGSGCGWTGHQGQGAPIESCALTPGDASPACRCPDCDSLAYPLDPDWVIGNDGLGSAWLAKDGVLIDYVTVDEGDARAFSRLASRLLEAAGIMPRRITPARLGPEDDYELAAAEDHRSWLSSRRPSLAQTEVPNAND